jgi:hypothetical protein
MSDDLDQLLPLFEEQEDPPYAIECGCYLQGAYYCPDCLQKRLRRTDPGRLEGLELEEEEQGEQWQVNGRRAEITLESEGILTRTAEEQKRWAERIHFMRVRNSSTLPTA